MPVEFDVELPRAKHDHGRNLEHRLKPDALLTNILCRSGVFGGFTHTAQGLHICAREPSLVVEKSANMHIHVYFTRLIHPVLNCICVRFHTCHTSSSVECASVIGSLIEILL